MSGEKSLAKLLSGMSPSLNAGDYVFCSISDITALSREDILGSFHEKEGFTVIVERSKAESLGLEFDYIAAWITLTVHSALDAVGLTAAFATALGNAGISCNVIAAFHHDHIFVGKADAQRAIEVLNALADTGKKAD